MSDQRNCSGCDEPIDLDFFGIEIDGRALCEECECEKTFRCFQCGEAELHDAPGTGVLVGILPSDAHDPDEPDDGSALRPGLYLVQRWPFYTESMIGPGWVHHDTLRRLGPLGEAGADVTPCPGQWLCRGCSSDRLDLSVSTLAVMRERSWIGARPRDCANPEAWIYG